MTVSANKSGNILKYVVLFVVVVNLAIVAVVFLGANSPQPRPMPNPNGYDDFVKAAQMVIGKADDYKTMSKDDLATLVATNQEALKLVRVGLGRECRMPDDYSPDFINRVIMPIGSFKQLASLIAAEGRLAELGGHNNEAANIYLDGIRFGRKSTRGGVIISGLVSIACEAISTKRLEPLAGGLDAQACRETAQALETIDGAEEPVEETLDREKQWARKAGGLREQFAALVQYKSIRNMRILFTQKVRANTLRRRQLMLTLAERAYELEKGKRASNVADLVPDYLKAVPQDPTTGTNLILEP